MNLRLIELATVSVDASVRLRRTAGILMCPAADGAVKTGLSFCLSSLVVIMRRLPTSPEERKADFISIPEGCLSVLHRDKAVNCGAKLS